MAPESKRASDGGRWSVNPNSGIFKDTKWTCCVARDGGGRTRKGFSVDRAAANSSLGGLAKSIRGAGRIADRGVFEGWGDLTAGPASPVCGSSVQGWVAGGICLMSAADFS